MVISANGEQQAWVMEKEIHGVGVGCCCLIQGGQGRLLLLRLLKEVRELAMWLSEGGAFQVEGREVQGT